MTPEVPSPLNKKQQEKFLQWMQQHQDWLAASPLANSTPPTPKEKLATFLCDFKRQVGKQKPFIRKRRRWWLLWLR